MKVKITLLLIVLALSVGCTYKRGIINLASSPSEAEVYVNYKKVGETPVKFEYDFRIPAALMIKKDGYRTITESLNEIWVENEYLKGRYGKIEAMVDGKMRTVWTVTTYRTLNKLSAIEPYTSRTVSKKKARITRRIDVGTPAEKLAVMDLKAKHGVKESLAEGLSVVIRDTIQDSGDYEVLSKEDVEVIAKRTAIRQSLGCDDTKCLIDIGRSLGTKFMVAGAISKFGDTYNISLRLLNTMGDDAGVKRRVNRNCKCPEDALIEAAKGTARQLLK